MIDIQELCRILSSQKFVLDNEKSVQLQIENVLIDRKIEYKREFSLNDADIIDFMIGDIGLEVKLKCPKRQIYRQCVRYAEHEEIKTLLLMSATAMGLPTEILGKPVYALSLTKAWL